MRRTAVMFIWLMMIACGGETTADAIDPPAATPAEMEIFCGRYEEVKNLAEKWQELEKVAPPEIKGAFVRVGNGPSEGYWDDLAAAEEFVNRCIYANR